MSIAQTAPDRFEFQDLASIDLALRLGLMDGRVESLVPEPPQREDAEIRFLSKGRLVIAELQVKSSMTAVTLPVVAEYLAHFPEGRTDGCLLERMLEDEGRIVVFVVAGRCDDDVSRYVVNPSGLVT